MINKILYAGLAWGQLSIAEAYYLFTKDHGFVPYQEFKYALREAELIHQDAINSL
jgi:hypothetical protein